jgi:hypothetical protein
VAHGSDDGGGAPPFADQHFCRSTQKCDAMEFNALLPDVVIIAGEMDAQLKE